MKLLQGSSCMQGIFPMMLPLPGNTATWPHRDKLPFHLSFQLTLERLSIPPFHEQGDTPIFEQPNRHILIQGIRICSRLARMIGLDLLVKFPLHASLKIVRENRRIQLLTRRQNRRTRQVLNFHNIFQHSVIGLTAPSLRIPPWKDVIRKRRRIQQGGQQLLGGAILHIHGENSKGDPPLRIDVRLERCEFRRKGTVGGLNGKLADLIVSLRRHGRVNFFQKRR